MFLFPSGATITTDASFYGDIKTAGLTTGLKLCLDTGSSTSYTGSGQSWLDLSGGGYDFYRGLTSTATSDDPTFNGTPGNLSSSEYWSFDGGDVMAYDSTEETWMSNIHKNNAKWSILMWVYYVSTGQFIICGQGKLTWVDNGWYWFANSGVPRVEVVHSSTSVMGTFIAATAMNTNAWNFIGISVDEAVGSGGGFHYLNGAYNQASSSDTWNSTYSSPSSSSSTYTMTFLGGGDGSYKISSGARLAGTMFWEGTTLTKANMDTIWNAQKGRFGL